MRDYSERRTVTNSTNRPKKQGMALYFILIALGGILAGFGIGLGSGWFMFKPTRQELNAQRVNAEKLAAATTPATAPQPSRPAPVTGPLDPNLSFYKTLPSGKAILGTGLNPAKPEEPATTQAAPPPRPATVPAIPPRPTPPAAKSPAVPAPASPERRDTPPPEKPSTKSSPLSAIPPPVTSPSSGVDQARKAQSKGRYVVQVASYQSKSDAEAIKERLIDSGLPAYIVEWVLKDKGIMYRVRVGKHLELSAAEELAVKAGKNAIPVLE